MKKSLAIPGRENTLFSSVYHYIVTFVFVLVIMCFGRNLNGQSLTRYHYNLTDTPDLGRLDIFLLKDLPTFDVDTDTAAGYIIYLIYGDGQAERRQVSLGSHSHPSISDKIADQWFIHKYLEPFDPDILGQPLQHDPVVEFVKIYSQDDDPPTSSRVVAPGNGVTLDASHISAVQSEYEARYDTGQDILIYGYQDLEEDTIKMSTSWNLVRGKKSILRINYSKDYFSPSSCDSLLYVSADSNIIPVNVGTPPDSGITGEVIIYNPPTQFTAPTSWFYYANGAPYSESIPVNGEMGGQEQRSVFVFFETNENAPLETTPTQVKFTVNGHGNDGGICPGSTHTESIGSSYDPNGINGPCCIPAEDHNNAFPYTIYFYNEGKEAAEYITVRDTIDPRLKVESVIFVSIGRDTFNIGDIPVGFQHGTFSSKRSTCDMKYTHQETQNTITWDFQDVYLAGMGRDAPPKDTVWGYITFMVSLESGNWSSINGSTLENRASITFYQTNGGLGIPVQLPPKITGIADVCCPGRCKDRFEFDHSCVCEMGDNGKPGECIRQALPGHDHNINIFPNPFQQSLTISLPNSISLDQEITISIFSMLGQNVFQQSLSGNEQNIELYPKLSSGMYLVKVRSGTFQEVIKVIKE